MMCRDESMKIIAILMLLSLSLPACSRDLSPAEVVKEYEDDVRDGNGSGAKDLLTKSEAQSSHDLFSDVSVEARNRIEEGVLSEKRTAQLKGNSATVIVS